MTLYRLLMGINRRLPPSRAGDRLVALLAFRLHHRRWPQWRRPRRLTDLYFANKMSDFFYSDEIVRLVDKELAKEEALRRCGDLASPAPLCARILAVARDAADREAFLGAIESEAQRAPGSGSNDIIAVVKPTHASVKVLFVRRAVALDRGALERLMEQHDVWSWPRTNYATYGGEAQYRRLEGKVIAEAFIPPPSTSTGAQPLTAPNDFKFFCRDGTVGFVQVHAGRFDAHTRLFLDTRWQPLPCTMGYPMPQTWPEKPACFETMISLASLLSRNLPPVRIDFLLGAAGPHFGEFTFTPANCQKPIAPDEWDERLGALLLSPIPSQAAVART